MSEELKQALKVAYKERHGVEFDASIHYDSLAEYFFRAGAEWKGKNATITTDNTKAAAELTIKLREANALIDTLVERLKKLSNPLLNYPPNAAGTAGCLHTIKSMADDAKEALVEAKKVRGE